MGDETRSPINCKHAPFRRHGTHSQRKQVLALVSGKEGKRLEVSHSRGLETPYSSNTHLLETHAQLASVPEGNSTRLVLVRIRQTRDRIHLLLWKNTASVSRELGS